MVSQLWQAGGHNPRFYYYDSALVNLLTRQPDAAAALAGQLDGPLLEGWVVT